MEILKIVLPVVGLVIVGLIILGSCVRIVPQSRAFVIERLGVFSTVWNEGLKFKAPFIERVVAV